MSAIPHNLHTVLAEYPADCIASSWGARCDGGLSGSLIWRLETRRGSLCLRRWPPEHPKPAHLRQIHDVLLAIVALGVESIPSPILTLDRNTFVIHGEHLWELTPWMPGQPFDFPNATVVECHTRIAAAARALAKFHDAVFAVCKDQLTIDRPPGIWKRRARLTELQSTGIAEIVTAIAGQQRIWPQLAENATSLFELFHLAAPVVAASLKSASELRVPLTPCIRDIHREHVLFEGSRVSGMIDFGAVQVDSLAGDLARMLGSMAGDRDELWQTGLARFDELRPLAAEERKLISVYDQSGVLLSGMNWLHWVFVERRTFENKPAVLARFSEIIGRLRHLTCKCASHPFPN